MIQWAGRTFLEPQVRGVTQLLDALDSGKKRIVFVSPTGTGKTLMAGYTINDRRNNFQRVDLRTYRRLLLTQLSGEMDKFGIPHGVIAAGMERHADENQLVQLVMTQTELSRLKNKRISTTSRPQVVFIDEAHNQLGGESGAEIDRLVESGVQVVFVTATPVGEFRSDDLMIEAGKNSEFRKLGLLLPCMVYAPDEPAAAMKLKPTKTGEFKEGDVTKAIMSPTIFGRVSEHYDRLNPDRLPAILFGPGVKESVWFAEQFTEAGIRAAHIDGEKVWIDGETHMKTQSLVDEIKRESETGRIKIVCNRFVLREGLDWPHLYHAILATVFGSLTAYLQSIGRLLRAHPSLENVIMQDHGGNYHRHGSPNADRIWTLGWDANRYASERQDAFREKKAEEPIVCPKCGAVRNKGPTCITCGHTSDVRGRMVVQTNGELRFVKGDIYKQPVVVKRNDTERLWESLYYGAKNSKRSNLTFGQLYGLFVKKNHYCPPKTLPCMPRESVDWHARVKDLSRDGLIGRN